MNYVNIIYQPSGMAREYSPYACNLYIGCSHRCKYCYAPHTLQRQENAYFGTPPPRRNVLRLMRKQLETQTFDKQVLLSFIGDVYCQNADESATTREALKLLLAHQTPVAVLSKGGNRCLKDLDVFTQFGKFIQVGTTLTFFDEKKSREWEPFAAVPKERLEVLKTLHNAGIKTMASFEPTIEPAESLKLIEQTLIDNSVDHYKIGKLNYYKGLDKFVDWQRYLDDVLALLRPAKKEIYIKKCLAILAPNTILTADETDPERYIVKR